MEPDKLLRDFSNSLVKQVKVDTTRNGFKVALPILEPNGDQIYVYLEEHENVIKVHDGGHINGVLFGVGPAGAANDNYKFASEIIVNAELRSDTDRGLVFAEAQERTLNYWMMEVGRTIAVIASVIPFKTPPLERPAKSKRI